MSILSLRPRQHAALPPIPFPEVTEKHAFGNSWDIMGYHGIYWGVNGKAAEITKMFNFFNILE